MEINRNITQHTHIPTNERQPLDDAAYLRLAGYSDIVIKYERHGSGLRDMTIEHGNFRVHVSKARWYISDDLERYKGTYICVRNEGARSLEILIRGYRKVTSQSAMRKKKLMCLSPIIPNYNACENIHTWFDILPLEILNIIIEYNTTPKFTMDINGHSSQWVSDTIEITCNHPWEWNFEHVHSRTYIVKGKGNNYVIQLYAKYKH